MMNKLKNKEIMNIIPQKNGITMVVLVITIIVMIIITGVTVYTGTNVIKQASLQNINTNMMLIQAKTKTIEEQANFNDDTSVYKGTKIADVTNNKLVEKLVSNNVIDDTENYYLLTQEDLNSMGLEKINIDDGYVVNYDTNEIIYVRGYESDNITYYKLSDLKNLTME
jgi:Tfp pilus assembly protein PilE